MVQGVTTGGQVGMVVLTAVRYAQADAPGVVMPVRRAQMVYASFKHIQVQPDSRLQDGVPLYKLRILDMLIDQMSRKADSGIITSERRDKPPLRPDAASIDALITGMSSDLRTAGNSRGAYRAGFFLEPGAFVDLVA
jgi:hypothetical protein